jgi:hypothetical protein
MSHTNEALTTPFFKRLTMFLFPRHESTYRVPLPRHDAALVEEAFVVQELHEGVPARRRRQENRHVGRDRLNLIVV